MCIYICKQTKIFQAANTKHDRWSSPTSAQGHERTTGSSLHPSFAIIKSRHKVSKSYIISTRPSI